MRAGGPGGLCRTREAPVELGDGEVRPPAAVMGRLSFTGAGEVGGAAARAGRDAAGALGERPALVFLFAAFRAAGRFGFRVRVCFRLPVLRRLDFRLADFRLADFRAEDFRLVDFRLVDFRLVDFRAADLRAADFRAGRVARRLEADPLEAFFLFLLGVARRREAGFRAARFFRLDPAFREVRLVFFFATARLPGLMWISRKAVGDFQVSSREG